MGDRLSFAFFSVFFLLKVLFFSSPAIAQVDCNEVLEAVNEHFNPFEKAERWVFWIRSEKVPISIFYDDASYGKLAENTLDALERAWLFSLEIGLRPPVLDHPASYGRLPVFLARNVVSGVESISNFFPSSMVGFHPTMVLDVDEITDPASLDSFVSHEVHHAFQASYSWQLPESLYEMSANYFQERFSPGKNRNALREVEEFQSRPELPIFSNYLESYFIYGSWLYFKFLEMRYFQNDISFLRKLWEQFHFADPKSLTHAFERILPGDIGLEESLLEFAKWRTFLGSDFPKHENEVSLWHFQGKDIPKPKFEATLSVEGPTEQKNAIVGRFQHYYGAHYYEFQSDLELDFLLSGSPNARWSLQQMKDGKNKAIVIIMPFPKQGQAAESPSLDYELRFRASDKDQ